MNRYSIVHSFEKGHQVSINQGINQRKHDIVHILSQWILLIAENADGTWLLFMDADGWTLAPQTCESRDAALAMARERLTREIKHFKTRYANDMLKVLTQPQQLSLF